MRFRTVVLSCMATAIILSCAYECSGAETKTDKSSLKIGVVSIRTIFQECRRNVKYRAEMSAERDKVIAELDKLAKEIDADKAGLKTLKEGSSDYLASLKEILEKQAKVQTQQEFYKQQMGMKELRWIEQLYKDILRATGEIAKQKGLDLVFEKSEPDLPAPNSNELTLTISTHKVLYSTGCVDITNEVMAKVDTDEGKKPEAGNADDSGKKEIKGKKP